MSNKKDTFNVRVMALGALILAISLTPRIPLPFYIPGRVFDLRMEDIILSFIFIFALANLCIRGRISKKVFSVPLIKPLCIYVVTMFSITLLSLLLQAVLFHVQQNMLRLFFYNLKEIEFFAVFLTAASLIRTESDLKKVCQCALFAGMINAVWAGYQVLSGHTGAFFKVELPEEVFQQSQRFAVYFIGTFGEVSPFSVAAYFAFVSYVFYAFFSESKQIKKKFLFFCLGVVFSVCSMLSFEKASVVFFIVAFLVLFLYAKHKMRYVAVIFILALLFVQVARYASQFEGYHARIISPEAYLYRFNVFGLGVWHEYLPYVAESMLLGFGKGSYQLYSDSTGESVFFEEAHNYYLKTLVECGIFGLAVFLWMLYRIGSFCRKTFKRSALSISKTVSQATFCMLIALVLAAVVQDAFKPVLPNMMFWFFVGLTSAAGKIEAQSRMEG